MDDIDLEDLESRLYSQIYHGPNEEHVEESISLSKPTGMRRAGTRYFGPWSPGLRNGRNVRPPIQREPTKSAVKLSPQVSQLVRVKSRRERKDERDPGWRERRKARRRDLRQQRKCEKALKLLNKIASLRKAGTPIIEVSDSDQDDSCVFIENAVPDKERIVVEDTIDNNLTLNDSLTDDVIFIEPEKVPIINLDEEFEVDKTGDNSSNTSLENHNTSSKNQTAQQLQTEIREQLCTPDSASNDFMNNSEVELNKRNFNFSLHGSDFKLGSAKPIARNETCETESSSSTLDVNAVNLMKTSVFNEIDFPRDDIFSEGNLEAFGNFITPMRPNAQSSPVKESVQNSSDSESDSEAVQNNSKLPDLSPMLMNIKHKAKKNKRPSIGSKFDLITTNVPDSPETRKKKKNKKKKQNLGENEANSSAIISEVVPNTPNEIVDLKEVVKQKKKKGEQLETSQIDVSQGKKKIPVEENLESVDIKQKKKKSEQLETSEIDVSQSKKKKSNENLEVVEQKQKKRKSVQSQTSEIEASQSEKKNSTENEEQTETNNVIASHSVDAQNVCKNLEISEINNSALDGLVVVDETFGGNTEIIDSDSDTVLSSLPGEPDIQLNWNKNGRPASPLRSDNIVFSVSELQKKMSSDPKIWAILESDLYPVIIRGTGRRCNRCRRFGHMGAHCPEKPTTKCVLCGMDGHLEARCPNSMCTQCGKRSPYLTTYCTKCFKYRNARCKICSVMGHIPDACPDLWRRYHLTTKEGPIQVGDGKKIKAKHELWCSGCARSGHIENTCRTYQPIYPSAEMSIVSYIDVYQETTQPEKRFDKREPSEPTINKMSYNNSDSNLRFIPPLFSSPPVNFGNQILPFPQAIDQRNYTGINMPQMNPRFLNPFADGVYVANQQNFFPSNLIQIPQNSFLQAQNQYQIPTFISFDDPPPPPLPPVIPPPPPVIPSPPPVIPPLKEVQFRSKDSQCNAVFLSSSVYHIHQFVNEELFKLSKLAVVGSRMLSKMRKRSMPVFNSKARDEYFETLNMLLFGVFKMNEGKLHLERLKKFKKTAFHAKICEGSRKKLKQSYLYIFGKEPHRNLDYNKILATL